MAKYYLLKFQFTHTEADNEHISAAGVPSTIWVLYFFSGNHDFGGKSSNNRFHVLLSPQH